MEELKKRIGERLSTSNGKPFAVFDFDNTLIVNDIGDAVFNYLCSHELLRDRTLLGEKGDSSDYHERVFATHQALVEEGKLKAACILNIRLFSGFTPGEAEAITLAAITEEGKKLGSKMLFGFHIERGLAPRRSVFELMDFVRSKGAETWIVSATAEPAIRAAMRHFGIEANLIASRLAARDGVFTSELLELAFAEGKAAYIRQYIDPEKSPLLVVGDAKGDVAMLEMAEVAAVIGGRELEEEAKTRGWFVL